MLARYYLLPTIGCLSLCTVESRIFVTRIFGDIFRLFQSCACDYQTNGARVRATDIVGILTGCDLDDGGDLLSRQSAVKTNPTSIVA